MATIPPTPSLCPNCKAHTEQKWWCLYCGKFYSNEHLAIYQQLAEKEIENVRNLINLLCLYDEQFFDAWPEDLTDLISKQVEIKDNSGDICISGFSIGQLLSAIKEALSKQ